MAEYEEFFGGSGAYMGADLTWTESEGGLKRDTDDLVIETVGTAGRGRAEHDTDTSDVMARLDIIRWNSASTVTRDAAVFVRMSSASLTDGYCLRRIDFNDGLGPRLWFQKVVGGTFTDLAPPVYTPISVPPNETLQITADGSTITGVVNGVTHFSVTDTAIPTGTRAGVRMRCTGASTNVECDNFFFRDLRSPGPTVGYIGPGLMP